MTSYADTAAGTTDTRNKYKILQGCNWQVNICIYYWISLDHIYRVFGRCSMLLKLAIIFLAIWSFICFTFFFK